MYRYESESGNLAFFLIVYAITNKIKKITFFLETFVKDLTRKKMTEKEWETDWVEL